MGITVYPPNRTFTIPVLEESARDRKNQLERTILQLKKMVTHLSLITDDEVGEYDVLED